jgi:hypothetical protein
MILDARLPDSLQALIDARLDTIDRMLLGRMSRTERLSIVKEVESQIYEQLHVNEAAELGRAEVLAVLGRLDPPEAYLPEERREGTAQIDAAAYWLAAPQRVSISHSQLARASGLLGLLTLGMIMIGWPVLSFLADFLVSPALFQVVFFVSIGLVFVVGLASLILGISSRMGNGWAITGITTGLISQLISYTVGFFALVKLLGVTL